MSPTPETTKFARVLSSGSGLHQKQKPQNKTDPEASHLGRELVGASPDLRRSHGFGLLGSLGLWDKCNDGGTKLLRNKAMGTDVQDSVVEVWWVGHRKRVSDNQRLGAQTSVSAVAECAK